MLCVKELTGYKEVLGKAVGHADGGGGGGLAWHGGEGKVSVGGGEAVGGRALARAFGGGAGGGKQFNLTKRASACSPHQLSTRFLGQVCTVLPFFSSVLLAVLLYRSSTLPLYRSAVYGLCWLFCSDLVTTALDSTGSWGSRSRWCGTASTRTRPSCRRGTERPPGS